MGRYTRDNVLIIDEAAHKGAEVRAGGRAIKNEWLVDLCVDGGYNLISPCGWPLFIEGDNQVVAKLRSLDDTGFMLEVPKALDTQEGGDHYKNLPIQPVEYIHANKIPYLDGNVIKYVTRHRNKNGAQDIKKAIHYLQMILDLEYGEEK